jgi:hypothetical protein
LPNLISERANSSSEFNTSETVHVALQCRGLYVGKYIPFGRGNNDKKIEVERVKEMQNGQN